MLLYHTNLQLSENMTLFLLLLFIGLCHLLLVYHQISKCQQKNHKNYFMPRNTIVKDIRYNKNFSLYSSENFNVRGNIMSLYFVHCSMSLIRPDRVRPPPPILIQCINIINSIIKSYQYHIPASIFSGNLSSLKNVAALLFFPLLP